MCLVSNAEISFVFERRLFGSTNGSLEVKKDGVGTYSLTFEKEKEEVWLYLSDEQEKVPIWYEIMGRNTSYRG